LAGLVEIERLIVVKQVTLAVVCGAAAGLLVAELWAPFNGQRLHETKKTKE
jgi:hypothetical protein